MIITLLKKSEERRNGTDLDDLFITVSGSVKASSRTIIAGWIRSVLRDAGIEGPPGSIRSAVASRGWLDNIPGQKILNRGNWRSVETFRKHYYKLLYNNILIIILLFHILISSIYFLLEKKNCFIYSILCVSLKCHISFQIQILFFYLLHLPFLLLIQIKVFFGRLKFVSRKISFFIFTFIKPHSVE